MRTSNFLRAFFEESGPGQGEEYYDPARKEDILGKIKKSGNVGGTSERPALAKALACLENPY